MSNRVTLLLFHPRFEASRVNKALIDAAAKVDGVVVRDMYELYPDFNVDIEEEQEMLLQTDLLVMHHPFYWYSCPPLLKQWIDLVLEHGWAYGSEGNMLKDKKVMHSISSGGAEEAYAATGRNLYTYKELLRPFELTYRLCKMQFLPAFVTPGAFRIQDKEIEAQCALYQKVLSRAVADGFGNAPLENVEYLNNLSYQ